MDADLAYALELADAADALTLPRFRAADLRVETKPDLTPVTDADRATERAAARAHRARPAGRERARRGRGRRRRRVRWIVDPIDGTRNFSRGIPAWATLIALERDGQIVCGVVSAPALGRRWWAARGEGAFANGSRDRASRRSATLADASVSCTYATRPRAARAARLACARLRRFLAAHARRRRRARRGGRRAARALGPRRARADRARGRAAGSARSRRPVRLDERAACTTQCSPRSALDRARRPPCPARPEHDLAQQPRQPVADEEERRVDAAAEMPHGQWHVLAADRRRRSGPHAPIERPAEERRQEHGRPVPARHAARAQLAGPGSRTRRGPSTARPRAARGRSAAA